MNKLFINNSIAVIDDEQKLLFSHKVNNLDDFTIINVPVSKTIQLPRCQQNDEIFGYIGEIQRITYNYDNEQKTSISFNQTKNINYELFDGGELISEGNIIVESINDNYYELTLYDKLINTLEELSGDEDGNGYLNALDIYYKDTNYKIEFPINSTNLPYYAYMNSNLKYTINIKDDDLKGKSFRCMDKSTNEPKTFELFEDLTQLQSKSVKSYDVEYAVPINGVIESINKKYNNIIEVDSKLSTYFDELHFYCGKAKKYDKIPTETTLSGFSNLTNVASNLIPRCEQTLNGYVVTRTDYGVPPIYYLPLKDLSNTSVTERNGKHYMEIPIIINLTLMGATDQSITYRHSHYNGINYDFSTNIPDNTDIGEVFLTTQLCKYISGTTESPTKENVGSDDILNVTKITNKIIATKGLNVTFTKNPSYNNYDVRIEKILVLEYDFNPLTRFSDGKYAIKFDLTNPFIQGENRFYAYKFSNGVFPSNPFYIDIDIPNGGKLIQTPSDKIENGDIINGKNIYPKISIKDFLVNLSKYHNLNIKVINNKINISKKLYTDQNDILQIVNVNSINPKLFDFSKLQISYELPNNDLINKTYLNINKQKYGQKNIDLNYTIKKTIKKVEYAVGIPALMKDTSKLGYDTFIQYYNGGRSKYTYGITNGFNEKIVFGFLNKINEKLVLTDDTWFELGCKSAFETNIPTEKSIVKSNMFIENNNDVYTFVANSIKGVEHATIVTEYYTISPYLFNSNGTIKKSLEINKPKYNYANLTDSIYPVNVTHYDRYLKKYIEEMYNVNNHILDCDILLENSVDINKIYHYKNVDYVINEIPEYDPSDNYIKGVKLLKVNDKNNYLYPYAKEEGNITILSYSDITQTGMTINERINYTGGDTIITGGVRYSTNPNNLNLIKTTSNPTISFSVTLTGLTKNTLYYIQPYMISQTGIYTYGEVYQKMTLDDYSVPTVTMTDVNTITYTTINAVGTINSAGGYPTTEYGFVYGTTQFPTTANNKKIAGTDEHFGTYGAGITGLDNNTTYYIRSYAINQNGIGYSSNQIIFTTNIYTIPTLSTTSPTNVRQLDGYSGGYNINNGGQDITEKGIVISVVGDPEPTTTVNVVKVQSGSGSNNFTTYFNNLPTSNEAYNIRAYAINSVGTGYGNNLQFSSLATQVPTMLIQNVNNLTLNGGDFLATMEYNGGYNNDIEEYGIIFHSTNPELIMTTPGVIVYWGNTEVYGTLTDGESFEININDLDPNVTYYYRSFAYNGAGIGYSEVLGLTTLSNLPTIENHLLGRYYNYDTTAYLNFSITGNYEVSEYGVIFSDNNTDPTFDDSEYIGWYGDPLGLVSTMITRTDFGNYTVGSLYCKMYALTPLGYIYSSVVNDTYIY